jgi:putative ABC transport system substrate-binding protein
MRRRAFLRATTAGVAFAAARSPALATEASPTRMRSRVPRIGVLGESNPLSWTFRSEAFDLECRWADETGRRLGDLALELLAADADVLVAIGLRPARAVASSTRRVPIVFVIPASDADADMMRGHNVTGVSVLSEADLAARRLGLLREIVGPLARVGVLSNPDNAAHGVALRETRRMAESRGIELLTADARMANGLGAALERLRATSAQAIVVLPDALFSLHAGRLAELAAAHRLPAIYPAGSFARAGGLMALHGDSAAVIDDVTALVRRILAGERPSSLPVRRQRALTLTVNRASAAALGVALPTALRQRASVLIG